MNAAIRDLYPSTSKYARRGLSWGGGRSHPLPAEPTDTIPGTPERLAVIAERCRKGEALFHPDDKIETRPAGRRSRGA